MKRGGPLKRYTPLKRTGFKIKPRPPLRRITPMKRAGKRVKEWEKTRAKLNVAYLRAGITRCEVRLPGCWGDPHGHAHTKKRRNIQGDELTETCLSCNPCHDQLEKLPEKEMAEKIRGIIARRESPVII